MNKIFKMFSVSVLSAFMLLASAAPIVASNDIEVAKDSLRAKEFPDEYLDLLDDSMIIELAESDDVFYDGKQEQISEISNIDLSNEIMTRGKIPSSKLKQTLYFSRSYSGNKLQTINVTAVGDWLSKPILNNWDMIGIDWDNSDWRLKDYSAKTVTVNKPHGNVMSSNSTLYKVGSAGFAIEAQLNANYVTTVNTTFQLRPAIANSKDVNDPTEYIQVYFVYAHKTGYGSLSATIGGFGVGVSISGNNDQAAISWDYSY
ncbi:hypothetical protein [Erysipelothrix anatis]|uniref:hypothetical protein n=1 Tax=Erysipelothrix anatis TaxID=2683713 RepID=UPI0013569B34|nr:hypothetical protein [Erysipelothrix anatis]